MLCFLCTVQRSVEEVYGGSTTAEAAPGLAADSRLSSDPTSLLDVNDSAAAGTLLGAGQQSGLMQAITQLLQTQSQVCFNYYRLNINSALTAADSISGLL